MFIPVIVREKKYVVWGEPIPWKRPSPNYKKRLMWDSQKAEKHTIANQLEDQHGLEPFFNGPLKMEIIQYVPIKGINRKNLHLKQGKPYIFKPDNSNYIKLYEDAAMGILYQDDCIIYHTDAHKYYDDGNGPRTEITLWEIK